MADERFQVLLRRFDRRRRAFDILFVVGCISVGVWLVVFGILLWHSFTEGVTSPKAYEWSDRSMVILFVVMGINLVAQMANGFLQSANCSIQNHVAKEASERVRAYR